MIVCVAGNPAIDKLFEIAELQPGEIHRPGEFVPLPGGKGIHVAQVATALGAEAIATGILGGHHGRWLSETLADEGVPGVFAWAAAGETRSCLTVADRATGSLTEFYEDGICATSRDWAELTHIVDALLAQGPSWLAMAGSVPAAADVEGYAQLVRAARAAACAPPSTPAARIWRAPSPSIPIWSRSTPRRRLSCSVVPPSTASRMRTDQARAVRRRAGGEHATVAVVVTLGEQGMILIDPEGTAWHGVVDAHGDYPVGSGDAFLAGLLTALAADPPASWSQAARLGLGAAAANAEVPGAARLDPARARELAARAEIRPLLGG